VTGTAAGYAPRLRRELPAGAPAQAACPSCPARGGGSLRSWRPARRRAIPPVGARKSRGECPRGGEGWGGGIARALSAESQTNGRRRLAIRIGRLAQARPAALRLEPRRRDSMRDPGPADARLPPPVELRQRCHPGTARRHIFGSCLAVADPLVRPMFQSRFPRNWRGLRQAGSRPRPGAAPAFRRTSPIETRPRPAAGAPRGSARCTAARTSCFFSAPPLSAGRCRRRGRRCGQCCHSSLQSTIGRARTARPAPQPVTAPRRGASPARVSSAGS
jgi:hypothetical protein